MATARFLKLSEEKRRRILKAGFREFADHPYREASINRIIKEADISRGSFYTYFEDKMSLLCFILSELLANFDAEVFSFLEKSNGDPFLCAEQIYIMCRNSLQASEAMGFMKNQFSDTEILQELTMPGDGCGCGLQPAEETPEEIEAAGAKAHVRALLAATAARMARGINREAYDLNDEQVRFLYPMLLMLTIRSAAMAVRYPEKEAVFRHALDLELGILKHGALRRDNENKNGISETTETPEGACI